MSTTEHERIEELLAVRALGGLEAGDLAEFDGPAHRARPRLRGVRAGRARVRRDRRAAGVRAGSGRRAVRDGGRAAGPRAEERPAGRVSTPSTARRPTEQPRRPRRARRRVARSAPARRPEPAGPGADRGRRGRSPWSRRRSPADSSSGAARTAEPSSRLWPRTCADPATQVVRFQATGGGNLAVAYRPGEDRSYVFGTDLQQVPAGKQYQLWTFPPGGGPPAPGPTFDAPSAGSPVVVAGAGRRVRRRADGRDGRTDGRLGPAHVEPGLRRADLDGLSGPGKISAPK